MNKIIMISLLGGCAISHGSSESVSLHVLESHDIQEHPVIKQQLKDVYLNAFKKVYRDRWTVDLEAYVIKIFDTYMERFHAAHDRVLVVAESNNVIAGWALFYKEEKRAILELICIDPAYWRQGLGKKLVFSIKERCPEVVIIAVVTRKINAISTAFYESLGFIKTDFMLPEYAADEMQGYELVLH